ncbi:MAG: hypothetical protein JJT96_03915 [Opitutales bacterium]|nr:hypothetical protein [Opitutales bacterium]
MPQPEPTKSDRPLSLFEELKQRKVFQVGVSYLIVGWLVIQVTVAVFPQFDIPMWASRFVILTVAAGFPLALILAWAFELTPDGVKSTRRAREAGSQEENLSPTQNRRRTRLAILVGALIPAFSLGIILGALAIRYFQGSDAYPEAASELVGIPADLASSAEPLPFQRTGESRPVLAILPFVNMSPDADNAFFTSGVHEDLLTNLSRISQLRVISRTSVMGYEHTRPSFREIAEDLRATHLVEGSVRRVGGRVRITAQLIDVRTEENIWANRFDRDLDDIFAIQSQVADEIALALRAELTPDERARLRDAPTSSVEAYDLFLRARELNRARDRQGENLTKGIELLRKALAIDPEFADAWSLVAWYHASSVHFSVGDVDEHLEKADAALARAQTLAPGHPNTLLAETYVRYHGRRDFDGALEDLARLRVLEPENSEMLAAEAFVLRRVGRYRESLQRLWDAIRLDPRNSSLLQQTLLQVQPMGNPHEVLEVARRLSAFYPEDADLKDLIFGMEMTLRPDIPRVRDWVAQKELEFEGSGQLQNFEAILQLASIYLILGEVDRAKAIARFEDRVIPEARPAFRLSLTNSLYLHARFVGDEAEAEKQISRLERLLPEVTAPSEGIPEEAQGFHFVFLAWRHLLELTVAVHRGDHQRARKHLEEIRSFLSEERSHLRTLSNEGGLRHHYSRARIILEPERAYEVFRAESARELPGLTLWSVSMIPLAFPSLISDPRFQRELADHPAVLAYVREVAPGYID